MRKTLEGSREAYVTIEQEAETLKYYMDLERLRFSNKFDYEIKIDPKIDAENMVIPPLLIQPIVENAILHGIAPKETNGKIEISFEMVENNKIICKVEDDGVGRGADKKEPRDPKHKSIAMEVTEDRLKMINKAGRKEMQLDVYDKKDETNKPTGTRIKFKLPILMA